MRDTRSRTIKEVRCYGEERGAVGVRGPTQTPNLSLRYQVLERGGRKMIEHRGAGLRRGISSKNRLEELKNRPVSNAQALGDTREELLTLKKWFVLGKRGTWRGRGTPEKKHVSRNEKRKKKSFRKTLQKEFAQERL